MNLNDLENKLNLLKKEIKEDLSIKNISQNILSNNVDIETEIEIETIYYSELPLHEKIYQQKNKEYKELISNFSQAYLELSDFYVGPELPREHYLQSKKDVRELYLLFAFYALAEPYIYAYYDKYC